MAAERGGRDSGRYRRRWGATAVAAVAGLLSGFAQQVGPVQAGELVGFQSPTGNIHCIFDDVGERTGSYPAYVRCDILRVETRPPPRPPGCTLEWGQAFAVSRAAAPGGEYLCVGDSVAHAALPVLPYGRTWTVRGFTCQSAETGVTCTNGFGRGFSIARARQQVF